MRKMLVLVCFCLALPVWSAAARGPRPNPSLSPADVVRIQLQAMRHNDEPTADAGIAIVFAFASPGNHKVSGSLNHFIEVIHAGYQPMLGNRKIILGATRIKGAQALQPVNIIASDGLTYSYTFLLTRQMKAPYLNCWMTDSVLPRDLERGNGLSL